MAGTTPKSSDQSPGGLAWMALHVIVAFGGIFALWSATSPYVYRDFVEIYQETWVYAWFGIWTAVVAGVGGVLEGTAAWAGYRRIGAALWVLIALFGILPFISATGHWFADEFADTRTFTQLVQAAAFWLMTCGCQYFLARRLASRSHPSS